MSDKPVRTDHMEGVRRHPAESNAVGGVAVSDGQAWAPVLW
ncbi:hypothetical protein SAMN02799620_05707 [Mycolicibacterium fluoranthenivorans]|jgi:hypothetical protein|uniref:Uncharacterized protein n=1 Tax=Mycolicibacterium fluoranthenivorans TaxID=258505 RepID=A0A1G4WZC6_9MYCO|nr:hypothetical protein SAMN02799620_05707 [Mycolicibacterium fluoranthenivorans]